MVKLFFTEVASDSSFFIEVIVENKNTSASPQVWSRQLETGMLCRLSNMSDNWIHVRVDSGD